MARLPVVGGLSQALSAMRSYNSRAGIQRSLIVFCLHVGQSIPRQGFKSFLSFFFFFFFESQDFQTQHIRLVEALHGASSDYYLAFAFVFGHTQDACKGIWIFTPLSFSGLRRHADQEQLRSSG